MRSCSNRLPAYSELVSDSRPTVGGAGEVHVDLDRSRALLGGGLGLHDGLGLVHDGVAVLVEVLVAELVQLGAGE